MNKVNSYFIVSAFVCLLAVSCGRTVRPQENQRTSAASPSGFTKNAADNGGGEMTFGISADDSKAGVTPTSGSNLGDIFVSAATGVASDPSKQVEYKFQSVTFSKNVSDNLYHGNPAKYWASEDIGYRFFASNLELPDAEPGSSPKIVFTDEFAGGIDRDVVCVYKPYSSSDFQQKITMKLLHIFSRIGNVTINAPVNGSAVSDLTVNVTPYVGGTFDLAAADSFSKTADACDKGWSDKIPASSAFNLMGGQSEIAPGGSVSNNSDLYLIPGTYTISVNYSLTMGDNVQTFTKTGSATIVRGSINTIRLTLPDQTLPEIVFEVTVQDWDSNEIDDIILVDA